MYRVMVVESASEDIGEVLMAMYRHEIRPYDSAKHTWDHAVKVKHEALKIFPNVIIEDYDAYYLGKTMLSAPYGMMVGQEVCDG